LTDLVRSSSPPGILSASAGKSRSVLDDPVWRLCLAAAGATVLAMMIPLVAGRTAAWTPWAVATAGAAGWVTAVRMLLVETRFRWGWILWLAGGLILLASPGQLGAARFTAFLFLLLRRYQPLRHLSSSRRGRLFLLSFLCLVLVLFGPRPQDFSADGEALPLRITHYAQFALGFFWAMVFVHLSLRARLHFLRLRTKLAIAVGFIAIVPLTLVIALGLLAAYGALGGRTADRGKDLLLDWSRLVHDRPEAGDVLFGEGFVDPTGPGSAKPPWWVPQTRAALQRTPGPDGWAPRDTTAFFILGKEMWLLSLEGVDEPTPVIRGWPVDETALNRVASLVRSDVGIALSLGTAGALFGRADPQKGDVLVSGHYHATAEADSSRGFFRRPIYFGGALLEALQLDAGVFQKDSYLLVVRTRLVDLARDFVTGSNEISLGLVILLATLAGLFLLVELASLFLGLRIAAGITSAVKALHQGTRNLARGNLETRIEIPNEDELGDLADSFNEMIQAVKRGQEELLARERYERELETAREIQRRLLPFSVPRLPGYQIAGISEPTRQVGGDYYDFLPLDGGRIGVAVGDVSGKGIPAALLMSNLQASLKGQILHPSSVSRTVSMVNQLLVDSTDTHMFATFFYGELDPRDGTLVSTNAGHDPPILCRLDGRVERLTTGGLVLGVMAGANYEEETVRLDRGDVLVIYTDGVTEAQGPLEAVENPSELPEREDGRVNLFEESRLIEVVHEHRHRPAQEIQAAILRAVRQHTAGTPQSDDITIVVIQRELEEVSVE